MVAYSDLQSGQDSDCWPFGEVDVVGVVVHITGAPHQTVYIANQAIKMCAVKFWGGLEVSAATVNRTINRLSFCRID